MHIMKRGLNYLRSGRRDSNKGEKTTQTVARGTESTANHRPAEYAPTNQRAVQCNTVDRAVNSRWTEEQSDRSLSSTGATLSSGEESRPESPVSTTTTEETYFEFERDLDSQHYLARHHQRLQRMSTRKLDRGLPIPNYTESSNYPNPEYLPPPPPSPSLEFRPSSRATIPRCSSRNSLDLDMENQENERPTSSQTEPIQALAESDLYAEIRKPGRPMRKRVCFRDPMSLSAIEEGIIQKSLSPVSANSRNVSRNLENVMPRKLALGFPSPSPFKSPAKPLPKTNPHFTLPKSFGTQLKNRLEYSSAERVCSYYDSDDGSFSSYSNSAGEYSHRLRRSRPGGASVGMNRVLAGLKSFGIKGELYVTVVLNRGLLTITIDECRNLVPPCSSPANSYVRLSLMPDEDKRTHCRTSLIPRETNPVFNQTFTIELLPEDYTKRLLISVWHRDLNTQKSSLLGCMAFTVKHLVHASKEIDGWYFLLAPSFGRHKHLAVDKVNMLTYYGSVDSGLQASSGTSLSSQDDQTLPGGANATKGKRQGKNSQITSTSK